MIAWKMGMFDITLLHSSNQVLHVFVTDGYQRSWLFSRFFLKLPRNIPRVYNKMPQRQETP